MASESSLVKGSSLQVPAAAETGEAERRVAAAPGVRAAGEPTLKIFDEYAGFVWRTLRRLGVPEASVDDGAQRVFMIVMTKAAQIEPGKEASFLYGTVRRVASDMRASLRLEVSRHSELDPATPGESADQPDELLERKQARQVLDRLLDELDLDTRAVFVLFELEGLTMAEIADLHQVPPGTVASRLRRARELMATRIAELQERVGGKHV